MASYSTITLDSHDVGNKSVHPSNDSNSFRVDCPNIHYPSHAECALTKLIYHHDFFNVHHLNKQFFLKISLPIPLWQGHVEDAELFQAGQTWANTIWPVTGDPLDPQAWAETRYNQEHKPFWHTKIYECHLTIGNHRNPELFLSSVVGQSFAMAEVGLFGVPIDLCNYSQEIFGVPIISKYKDGLRLSNNVSLFLHHDIVNLLAISTGLSSAVWDEDFSSYVTNYRVNALRPDIAKYRRFNNSSLSSTNTLPRRMIKPDVKFDKKISETEMSRAEIYMEVETDIVRSTHVFNNRLTRILFTTRRMETFGNIVTIEPKHLIYLPTIGANFGSIQINIKAWSGSSRVILNGRASVTLQLQTKIFTQSQQ